MGTKIRHPPSGLRQPLWETPLDEYHSPTSDEQVQTEAVVSELLRPYRTSDAISTRPSGKNGDATPNGSHVSGDAAASSEEPLSLPLPALNRSAHLSFLRKNLQPLPGSYVAFDSNRSWLLYWALHGHDLLGQPWGGNANSGSESAASSRVVLEEPGSEPPALPEESHDAKDRRAAVETLLSFQNKETGGFGGGVGQVSHLMSTYAAISALAIVGAPGYTRGHAPTNGAASNGSAGAGGPGAGWDEIDR